MPTESIVFSPEIDDRALSRETKQVNQQLEESTQGITPEFEGGNLDSLMPAGGGGGMGDDGLGPGAGAAGASLASRIPKPIAGVTAAAAIPVALAGGIGVGMLSAMHGASARLQTSTSLLGQAWNNVWRPIGDKVDQLFIRDPVMDLVSATQDFETAFRSADWIVDPVAKGMTNALQGDIVSLSVNARDLGLNLAEKFPSLASSDVLGMIGWPSVGQTALLQMVGWPGIAASMVLGEIGWPKLSSSGVIGGIGWPTLSAAAVTNPISWPAIGAGMVLGQMSWPTLTLDAVLSYLTDPSKGDGQGRSVEPVNPIGSGGNDRGEDWTLGGGSGNGDVAGSGVNAVSNTTNVEVDNSGLEESMDRVYREIQRMNQQFGDMGIVVNDEKIGRVTQNARQNRISDTDPTVL